MSLATVTRATAIEKPEVVDKKKREIRFCVSDESVDSHGSIIQQDGIDWEKRYERNPLFLWQHPLGEMCGAPEPDRILGKKVGKVDLVSDEAGPRTYMTFRFLSPGTNPKADMVFLMYLDDDEEKGGPAALNACSIGLVDAKKVRGDGPDEEVQELREDLRERLVRAECRYVIPKSTGIEVSAVLAGSNLGALAQRDLLALVDRRMEARERAFCARANAMMDEGRELVARFGTIADRMERALALNNVGEVQKAEQAARVLVTDQQRVLSALKGYL